ncbi:MAG: STAS domain-containing protein [Planctomycetota bacterium]|jgi:anti-anti-sigma factor
MSADWNDDIAIADLADEPALSEELAGLLQRVETCDPQQTPHIVLNFHEVTYLNSSNIAQLLRLRTLLGGADRHLRICNLEDAVWSVFMVTGLDKVFEFFPNPAVAIASLQIEKAEHDSNQA